MRASSSGSIASAPCWTRGWTRASMPWSRSVRQPTQACTLAGLTALPNVARAPDHATVDQAGLALELDAVDALRRSLPPTQQTRARGLFQAIGAGELRAAVQSLSRGTNDMRVAWAQPRLPRVCPVPGREGGWVRGRCDPWRSIYVRSAQWLAGRLAGCNHSRLVCRIVQCGPASHEARHAAVRTSASQLGPATAVAGDCSTRAVVDCRGDDAAVFPRRVG